MIKKNDKTIFLISGVIVLLLISLSSAISVNIPSPPLNYSLVNVNNSQFLQGHPASYFQVAGSYLTTIAGLSISTLNNDANFITLANALTGLGNWSADKVNYVPYTGATGDVNLGIRSLTTTTFIQDDQHRSTSWSQIGGIFENILIEPNTISHTSAISHTDLNIWSENGNISFDNENLKTTGNVTANYGFFSWLGSITNRITKGWFTDIDTTNATIVNLNVTGNATFMGINHIYRITACSPLPCMTECSNQSGGLYGNYSAC